MEKVYLFGGGNNAYGVIAYLGRENIIAIVDNEPKKQGKQLLGISIIGFSDYVNCQDGETIVITTAMFEEIIRQLENNGIENYTIAPMIIMGIADADQIIKEWRLFEKNNLVIIGCNIVSEKICNLLFTINPRMNIKVVVNTSFEIDLASRLKLQTITYDEIEDNDQILLCKESLDSIEKMTLNRCGNVYDVFSLMPESNRIYKSRLELLKGIHDNEECFIVGNGPSLLLEDLEKIHELGIPSFGLNMIYKLYNSTKWKPAYYVVTEYNIYRTYYDEIKELPHENMFIKNFYYKEDTPDLENANYYPGYAKRGYYDNQRFSNDISQVVYAGYTVAFDALQIAVYMGFKTIYLIGMDFSYLNDPSEKGNHVYDNISTEKRVAVGRIYLDASIEAMKSAKKYADEHRINIYNATRGGKLEVFERVDIDNIFAEGKK